MVIVVDNEDRENEGDFICASELISPETINTMAKLGRGLICTAIEPQRAQELGLDMMVSQNTDANQTAFTVSIDLIGHGCTTGISAYDRATCIKAMTQAQYTPADFSRPGHVFPLVAKKGGVLKRVGHTEAAVDLAKLAGLYPSGVLVEIMNEDGTMARLPQLRELATELDIPLISIDDLVAYRLQREQLVRRVQTTAIDSVYGQLELHAFEQLTTGDMHIVIKKGSWEPEEPVLVRMHSSSETIEFSQLLYSGESTVLQKSLSMLRDAGKGIVVFMRHKEKEADILTQLRNLSEPPKKEASRSAEKNQRDYGIGAQIIRAMAIQKIKLITNNPKRRVGLVGYGLEIVENIEL
ncbi:3,4-dihydroxy-2-butanone-4-phosphate synthase [Sediminicola luteus]|uniref:3,4-dihydroxy-2-butanone 4-phosphate synthase n=2 Tax=Sediminicola luteus TaxID=319238 RepID=A0A2A4GFM1_9FLAO|nr:3,4-dihydroxy-2-butanone-4-phosphate synthase [Sediminicola luteus]